MISRTGVQGTQATVPEVEVNFDLVYVRKNILKVSEVTDENGMVTTPAHWQYDEQEMTVGEYTEYIKNNMLEESLSTMEAITQLYESNITQEDLNLSTMEVVTSNFETIMELQDQISALKGGTV